MNEIERELVMLHKCEKRGIPVLEFIPMWVLADSKEVWYKDFGTNMKLYDTQHE